MNDDYDDPDYLDDWLEFKIGDKYISVKREFISHVLEIDTGRTSLFLKNGKEIEVQMDYDEVMKMI